MEVKTPTAFIEQARGILNEHNELESVVQVLQAEITSLEAESQALVNILFAVFGKI